MAVWRPILSELYTESDLNLLIGLSQQAAIAIDNAKLYRDAEGPGMPRRMPTGRRARSSPR